MYIHVNIKLLLSLLLTLCIEKFKIDDALVKMDTNSKFGVQLCVIRKDHMYVITYRNLERY